jgi:hypothetical protein
MPNASWRRRGSKVQGEGYRPPEVRWNEGAVSSRDFAQQNYGEPLALR